MLRSVALALFLLAAPALSAGQLDAVRGQAVKARAAVGAVRSDQMARRSELNTLSARIETLKGQSQGKLLPGGELDGALKKSQELSDQLTGLAQALAARESELETANLALLEALSAELTRLRGEFDRQTDRNARMATIKKLRQARAEREQVRTALPASRVPAMLNVKPSDDPEDLLEQADLMRDREDQVRKQLKGLEQRIAERRDERELDRRVNQFLGEESFFDDSDRRLRIRREVTIPTDAKVEAPAAGFTADPGGAANKSPTTRNQVGVPYDSATDLFGGTAAGGMNTLGAAAPAPGTRQEQTPQADPTPPPSGGAAPGENDAATGGSTTKVSQGSDARPLINPIKRVAGGDDEDLEDLEIQRTKLKSLAEELKARAKQLEKKAAELR